MPRNWVSRFFGHHRDRSGVMRNFLTALGLLALSSVGSVAQAAPHGGGGGYGVRLSRGAYYGGYGNNFGGYQYSNSPGFGVGFGMGPAYAANQGFSFAPPIRDANGFRNYSPTGFGVGFGQAPNFGGA